MRTRASALEMRKVRLMGWLRDREGVRVVAEGPVNYHQRKKVGFEVRSTGSLAVGRHFRWES